MQLRCLIVDDEVHAQNIIEQYISKLNDLVLIKKCDNAIEALPFLNNSKVDLVFLDINMPELTGIELLKTLKNPPSIILTTAYSEYALESYEYGVIDYLLKPISFERFVKAVNKAANLSRHKHIEDNQNNNSFRETDVCLRTDGITVKVLPDKILYFESYGNYIKVHKINENIIVRSTLQELEKELPQEIFIRTHKSFIVNISKIDEVHSHKIVIKSADIPIGTTYRQIVTQKLSRKKI